MRRHCWGQSKRSKCRNKINELVSDPSGTDTGLEWVELYNSGATSVDVSSWAVASGTSSFSGLGIIPEGTVIPAGAFLVVGQSAIAVVDVVADGFSLGNASSNSDGARIEDCNGTAVDTVIYGTPNTDSWVDDTGAVATSLGPVATNGASIGHREEPPAPVNARGCQESDAPPR